MMRNCHCRHLLELNQHEYNSSITLSNRSATVAGGAILSSVAKWNSWGTVMCRFVLQNIPRSPLLSNIYKIKKTIKMTKLKEVNEIMSLQVKSGGIYAFLFKGLALNFGTFSSTSFSSSSVLLILGGRALREVWRTGDLGAVRWNFHWWFCHKQIKNLLIS